MPLNIEPLDRNQTTAFREREALRQKVNEIIEVVTPMEITWDTTPTQGHGIGYAVTSDGIKAAFDAEDVEIDLSSDSFDGFKGILDNNTGAGALYSVVLSLAIQTVDFRIIINTSGSMRCGLDNPRSYTTILGGVIGLSNQGTTLVYPVSGITITQDGLSLAYIVNDELTERTIPKTDMLSFTTATAGLNVIYR